VLKTSPGLPQTDSDKKIFYPNWELRPGWVCEEYKDNDGKQGLAFRRRGAAPNPFDCKEKTLAAIRGKEFEKISTSNGFKYRKRLMPTWSEDPLR
jgi:hypothetical protein